MRTQPVIRNVKENIAATMKACATSRRTSVETEHQENFELAQQAVDIDQIAQPVMEFAVETILCSVPHTAIDCSSLG